MYYQCSECGFVTEDPDKADDHIIVTAHVVQELEEVDNASDR